MARVSASCFRSPALSTGRPQDGHIPTPNTRRIISVVQQSNARQTLLGAMWKGRKGITYEVFVLALLPAGLGGAFQS